MLFNQLLRFSLLAIAVGFGLGDSTNCVPTKSVLLKNCSFIQDERTEQNSFDRRQLSMIVPYALNKSEENQLLISILRRQVSSKALIRLNLNLIRCSNIDRQEIFWFSYEFSSTITGEFVRTNVVDRNQVYLPPGTTYLKNLTSVDCKSKTVYRTDDREIFRLDLRLESTLNDQCLDDQTCSPMETYRCDSIQQRCVCREPFESYLIDEYHPICIQAASSIDQCQTKQVRCFQWCHLNQTSSECFCPQKLAIRRFIDEQRSYCEIQTGGICNSFLPCSKTDQCLDGICQSLPTILNRRFSLETLTFIVISISLTLMMISLVLAAIICILRRQRHSKQYQSPIETVSLSRQTVQVTNDDFLKIRRQFERSPSEENDESLQTTSEPTSYEPKVLFLGGEQQLTAIFA